MNLFQIESFLGILKQKVKENEKVRGYLGKMAEAVRVHPSYLTRVLQGDAQFSLDQTMLLCGFWKLNAEETHFVLNRAIEARSAIPELQKWARNKANEVRERNETLAAKLQPTRVATTESDEIYYTHWTYGALHMAVMVPGLQTVKALSRYFGLAESHVQKVLEDLHVLKLVEKTGHQWRTTEKQLHLGNDSPFASPYHTSWRIKGMNQLDTGSAEKYQFTGTYALSKADFSEFISTLKEFIRESHQRMLRSPEEMVAAVCIDTFIVK